ncbi:bromodomain-containing protein 8-like [Vanessa cardui]|uniref:bromodomain-containing protein 8-like n=1 Tax=Vanessa cardui TaxID=171605 RepID=UPI001F144BEB|nr:bromodomain-containing protein 8-like [Vanessa cardui]
MSSVQERLQLKRVPLDTWNVREQLCLASAVVRSGDQNWMSVSRALKTVGEPNRPPDWYSQKSCAAQYGALLEHVETPKRKKRNSEGGVETPQESILKQLTQQRILEIQSTLSEMNNQYEQLKNEIAEVRSQATGEERIQELWAGIEAAKRARERECARRAAWLKERDERRARAERTWRPAHTPPPTPTAAPPSSPLLTSLLKSSPVVTTPQHIPHPATVVDSVSPSAGAPTLSLLLEQAQDSKNAAIEHIKSQLVQIEHQLKASTQATVAPQPVVQPAPAVDIDDIEIKAEDVYAFRDIDIHIPPVTALHKGNVRVAEKPIPKKEVEAPPSEPEVIDPPAVEVKEEPVPEAKVVEEALTPDVMETVEEQEPEIEEKAPEPKETEVKIAFPEVKFPTLEIKVIQLDEHKDSQVKEEVKEPEPEPEPEIEPVPPEVGTENVEDGQEMPNDEEKIADEPEQIQESPATVAEEAVEPPPVELQPEEEAVPDPQDIPLPPEVKSTEDEKEVPEVIQPPEPLPEEQTKVTEEVEENDKKEEEPVVEDTEKKEEVPEERLIEDIKKEEDAEDSIPLKDIRDELSQEEVKREGLEEDTHTETDDDTPMELSREEEKDGKKKRDYSRKKKSDSRTCSGSESAPESPSASDAERQHRLWKKSVMLVYSRLCAHKYASLFLRPISDEEAPGYSVVVKRPMDLSTVRRNIDAGNVRTTAEFQRDVLLMLSNALLYNSSSHSVYAMAREMHEDAQCQLGMLLAAQAHAGLCAPPRRKRRPDAHAHAPHAKHHRA